MLQSRDMLRVAMVRSSTAHNCIGLVWLALALVGCTQPPRDPPARPEVAAAPAAAPAEPAAPAVAPATDPAAATDRCRPPMPDPAPGGLGAGPAYVLVDRVGVLRIDDGKSVVVLPIAVDSSAWDTEMVVGSTGELWLSDWQGVRVLDLAGELRSVRKVKEGPLYEHLVVRSPTDVWAVTGDIEWEIVHYDGKRWTSVRRRGQFPGRFDDNKFEALAVTGEAVWVSSWNGLWRGIGAAWQKIEVPAAVADTAPNLWTYRDRVIVGDHNEQFQREGDEWRNVVWPPFDDLRVRVGEVGLVAGPNHGRPTVWIAAFNGRGCTATSEKLQGSAVGEVVVDQAGRVWAATDHALAVLDRDGRILREWTSGTLEGLTSKVVSIAVVGQGPASLPAVKLGRTWEIVGRMTIYKNSKPLANAALELCSTPAPYGAECPVGAFVRKATTGADGSYRFFDVPEGDLWIRVQPPAGLEDCESPFTVMGASVSPARSCRPAKDGALRCDIGVSEQCLPFEMPPGG